MYGATAVSLDHPAPQSDGMGLQTNDPRRRRSPARRSSPVALAGLVGLLVPALAVAAEPRFSVEAFPQQIVPLVGKYCVECHGPDQQDAGLAWHQDTTVAAVRKNYENWTKAWELLQSGAMPPDGSSQPTDDERRRLVRGISAVLNLDCQGPSDPGRVTIRRLNRTEYDNTVRDLTGLDLHLGQTFPADDVGEGFDNIGDVLSLPPLLLEKYVDAAERIAQAAIVDSTTQGRKQHREQKELTGMGSATLGDYGVFSLSSSGLVTGQFEFPREGQYLLRLEAGTSRRARNWPRRN